MQVTESKRRVEVTKVLAPNFIVPGIKKDGKSVCLADFGDAPFELALPLYMLAPHIATRASFPAAAPTAAALSARATAAAGSASSTADAAAAGPSGRVVASEDGSEDGSAGGPAHRPPMGDDAGDAGDADDADDADEQGMQVGFDGDYPTMSTADVERIRAASAAVAAAAAAAAAAATATCDLPPVMNMRVLGLFDGSWDLGTIVTVHENGSFDVSYDDKLLEHDVKWGKDLRPAPASATAAVAAASTSPLDSRPTTIKDFFSCVLGDGFHYMDRPKVPG